jgi:hypothetical protein
MDKQEFLAKWPDQKNIPREKQEEYIEDFRKTLENEFSVTAHVVTSKNKDERLPNPL